MFAIDDKIKNERTHIIMANAAVETTANRTSDSDLIDAIEMLTDLGYMPDYIARQLHVRTSDVVAIQRTGSVPVHQLFLAWGTVK